MNNHTEIMGTSIWSGSPVRWSDINTGGIIAQVIIKSSDFITSREKELGAVIGINKIYFYDHYEKQGLFSADQVGFGRVGVSSYRYRFSTSATPNRVSSNYFDNTNFFFLINSINSHINTSSGNGYVHIGAIAKSNTASSTNFIFYNDFSLFIEYQKDFLGEKITMTKEYSLISDGISEDNVTKMGTDYTMHSAGSFVETGITTNPIKIKNNSDIEAANFIERFDTTAMVPYVIEAYTTSDLSGVNEISISVDNTSSPFNSGYSASVRLNEEEDCIVYFPEGEELKIEIDRDRESTNSAWYNRNYAGSSFDFDDISTVSMVVANDSSLGFYGAVVIYPGYDIKVSSKTKYSLTITPYISFSSGSTNEYMYGIYTNTRSNFTDSAGQFIPNGWEYTRFGYRPYYSGGNLIFSRFGIVVINEGTSYERRYRIDSRYYTSPSNFHTNWRTISNPEFGDTGMTNWLKDGTNDPALKPFSDDSIWTTTDHGISDIDIYAGSTVKVYKNGLPTPVIISSNVTGNITQTVDLLNLGFIN